LTLSKLRTTFQLQQHIIYKLVQFLQLVCFLSWCSSHTVCICRNKIQISYQLGFHHRGSTARK